jgi:hypothetical protein
MSPTVSVCISAYGEPLFLRQVCSRICNIDIVEAVYILDGPYRYCFNVYKECGFYIEESHSPIKAVARDFPKARYTFDLFEDEAEKRIRLYNSAHGDIVLLLDLDEVPESLSENKLKEFWDSAYTVAPIEMLNITSYDASEKTRSNKYALFKRREIGATQHLDYTWLIGVNQNKPNPETMMPQSICRVDHYFLLRNRSSLLQKCLFYNCLWYYSNKDKQIFSSLTELAATFGLANSNDKQLILDSLLATSPDYNGFRPGTSEAASLPASIHSRVVQELQASLIEPFFTRRSLLPARPISTVNFHIPLSKNQIKDSLFCKIQIESTQDVRLEFSLYMRDLPYQDNSENHKAYRMLILLGRQSRPRIPDSHTFAWTVYLPLTQEIRAVLHEAVLSIKIHQDQEQLSQIGHSIELTDLELSSERLRITGFGNCQIESILECMKCSNSFSHYFELYPLAGRLVHLMSDKQMEENKEIFKNSDVVILQPVKEGYRDTRHIHSGYVLEQCGQSSAQAIMIPSLFYSAQNPWTQTIAIDDVFLDKPSPLHDLYLVYLAMSYPADISISLYNKAVDSPNFICQQVLERLHQNGIEALRQRESEAVKHFGEKLHSFISYSEYIESNRQNRILHYSDAHPMEDGIQYMTSRILNAMGFGVSDPAKEFSEYRFRERGMFPLYRSLATQENLDSFDQASCYLHNHELPRQEMIQVYCSNIYGHYRDLLPQFIRSYDTRFLITNDTTGGEMLETVFANLSTLAPPDEIILLDQIRDEKQNEIRSDYDFNSIRWALLKHCQHFIELFHLYPHIRYRILQIVQNPIDIIYSDVAFHLDTNKEWSHKKIFCLDHSAPSGFRQLSDCRTDHSDATHSYQEALRSLHMVRRIEFATRFHATTQGTIDAIGSFINQFESDPNIMLQPLELISTSVNQIESFLAFSDQEKDIFRASLASSIQLTHHPEPQMHCHVHTPYQQAVRRLIRRELTRIYPNNGLLKLYGLV